MIGIVNYGMGNLRSVQKALELVNAQSQIVDHPDQINTLDKLIVPGVGAFRDAMANLQSKNFVQPIRQFADTGKPLFGICLGLALFLDASTEDGDHTGIGLIPGTALKFQPSQHAFKVPHMGWNSIEHKQPDNPLMADVPSGSHVYFVHSYYAHLTNDSDVATITDYDGPFCSSLRRDNIYATQFHPEKSQKVGMQILRNFAQL